VGKALIIAAAVPLAIAKNGLRIFVIAELGTRVDRGFLDGNLHHHGGIVFLGVAMVVVVALIWFLHRWEVGRPRQLHARRAAWHKGKSAAPKQRARHRVARSGYFESMRNSSWRIFDAFDL